MTRGRRPGVLPGCAALLLLLAAARVPAAPVDLATLDCGRYETEILAAPEGAERQDPIDTVMWLFGFSVATSGDRTMYGDSLAPFGFALDGECKANPRESLLDAVRAVKSKRANPMDLTQLGCPAFMARHAALRGSDPESATTLTMWLFGYAVGLAHAHVMDPSALERFDAALADRCAKHPEDSLFDALSAPNAAIPDIRPRTPRAKAAPAASH